MSDKKIVTLSELQAHNDKNDLYILINGKGVLPKTRRVACQQS